MAEDSAVEKKVVVATTTKTEDSKSVLQKFLSSSGYKEADVLGYNSRTNIFVTSNGGKYQLLAKSGRVRRLAGPEFPKEVKETGE